MKRTRIPLIAAALLLLTLTATASAGTFTLHSCQTPSGTFVGDEGWVARSAAPSPGFATGEIERCDPLKRSLDLSFDAGEQVKEGQWLKATLSAAPNTSITHVSLVRSYHLGWPFLAGTTDRPYAYHAWYGDGEGARIVELRVPVERYETLSQPTPAAFDRVAAHWSSVSISLKCWGFYGANDCDVFSAALSLSRATFAIDDVHPPTGSADVGAVAGGVRGSAAIGVSASDVGGGVYRAIVSVDGQVLARKVLDGNGGTCGDVEPGNGDAYEFAVPRPCALDAAGDVTLDTRGLSDGQHQLRVEVEDAAGNATLLHEGVFTTRNGPVATVVPSIPAAGGPRVGDVLLGLGGSWDGALGEPELRWLRCDAAGEGCAAIPGAIGGVYAVTPVDVGARLVLEERTSNANGTGSARSQPTAVVADKPAAPTDPEPGPPGGGTPPPTGNTTVQAEAFGSASGVSAYPKAGANGGQTLGYVDPGDWAAYPGLDLTGVTSLRARVVSGGPGGTLQVRTGSPSGPVLGQVAVPNTGSWTTFADVSTALTGVPSGTQTVHLTFTGSGSGLFDVDDFTLVRSTGTGGAGPIKGLAGKCLDVRSGSSADGTQIQLYTCNGSSAQSWTVTPNGPVKALGKCLDVSGGGSADGTKIQLYTCNGTGAQNWSAQADGTVRNPQSGKCLDVSGNNSADGTAVHLWTCTGAANQRWTLP